MGQMKGRNGRGSAKVAKCLGGPLSNDANPEWAILHDRKPSTKLGSRKADRLSSLVSRLGPASQSLCYPRVLQTPLRLLCGSSFGREFAP